MGIRIQAGREDVSVQEQPGMEPWKAPYKKRAQHEELGPMWMKRAPCEGVA